MLKTVFPRLFVTALFLALAQIAFSQTADDIVARTPGVRQCTADLRVHAA